MSLRDIALVAFFTIQIGYLLTLAVMFYFRTRRVDDVADLPADVTSGDDDSLPTIVLLYPVLRELEETMRTTMLALAEIDYPTHRYRVVAIPNYDDAATIESLGRLADEFDFLQVLPVPATSDPSWQVVWDAWNANDKAYWWHEGKRAGARDLPPKKTRQLIYAFYTLAQEMPDDWALNYIDADSAPPVSHFRDGARGLAKYDVVQAGNISGNLLQTWPATFHSMDHMAWDGWLYPHLSAGGKHPFWVLGKGLFFKKSDLVEHGGFNPWLTIEDPEVGMRLWRNGKRLGIVRTPLIEEVPVTVKHGVTQRKRWVAGFLQSVGSPLKAMGYTRRQRLLARLNLVPCLSLLLNPLGALTGIWALVEFLRGHAVGPTWFVAVALLNIVGNVVLLGEMYARTWVRTKIVLDRRWDRLRFMVRVSPPFLFVYWLLWCVPIAIGVQMFVRDRGLVWERTEKGDSNHALVRATIAQETESASPAPAGRRAA